MPAKKAAAKSAATKAATKAASKSAGVKPLVKRAASKTTATKKAAGKTAAHKTSSSADYTDPDLRERIKEEVLAGDKGGRPGQWSARKAQLVATEYKAQGGDYKHKGERTETQSSLQHWGEEKWHTADGKQAIQGEETHRYLPDKAWNELSPEEKKATDRKKVEGSREGEQFVANTAKAKTARKHAVKA